MASLRETLALGRRYQKAGDFPRAEAAYREVVRADAANADAWHLLARACLAQRKYAEAEAGYRQALRLRPDSADAHNNLGVALLEQGRPDAALAAFDEATRLGPAKASAHNNRGLALDRLGRRAEALESLHEALRLAPYDVDAQFNLGNVLLSLHRCDEAAAAFRRVVQLKPDHAGAHNNLGNALKDQGLLDEALGCYRAAVKLDPANVVSHSNLLLTLQYHPGVDATSRFAEHRRWAERHAPPLSPRPLRQAQPEPGRRLRVGYVSPDFCVHSVARFIEPVLDSHDHQAFEIVCYADVARPDRVTQRLHGLADRWRSITGVPDAQAAELIRRDEIDILVDLAGHTAGNRLPLFAHRPAPIQVTYLGYGYTTGMTAVDYCFTDAVLDPPGLTERYHTEEIVRLPEIAWCYQPDDNSPEVGPLPCLEAGHVSFGAFHKLAKVTPEVLALWSRVLAALPGSRLLMVTGVGKETDERLRATFAGHGIDLSRVELLPRKRWQDYMRLHGEVDLALDSFPFNGGTTTCDSLWMGVPIITLAGDRYAARQGASLLSHLGLHDLIALTPEAYVDAAVRLANDAGRLRELRAGLRDRMKRSTLIDGRRFTRGLEEVYRRLWQQRQAAPGAAPADPLALARQCHQAGDVSRAEQFYRQILSGDPARADVWYLLGVARQTQGDLADAATCLRQAGQQQPGHAAAHNHLGVVLAQQGQFEAAAASFREALRLQPENAEAHANLGHALLRLGQRQEAAASFEQALRLRPDHPQARAGLRVCSDG
jgi:predicted O-linked N-acetylglucosamine transferase (SPINDLY family)